MVEGARVREMPLPPLDLSGAAITGPDVVRDRRVMFRQLPFGAVPGYAPICCDSNDPLTVKCAFKKRVLKEPPQHPSLSGLKAYVSDFVSTLPVVEDIDFESWLDRTSYTMERKAQLRARHEELHGGLPTRRQCSHVDSFVKTEFYPDYKHARMINSRSDCFKVTSGPAFKAIEDIVFALPEFIKHTPVADRPAKIRGLRRHGRTYFATDFTAFESHFTAEVLDAVELVLYRHCLKNYPTLSALICSTLSGVNHCRTRSGVRAKVDARRMSGDMCTSLGNGFTNLMLAKYLVHLKGGILEGFVEGDDGIFSTNVNLTKEDYANLGFEIKIEQVEDPCIASFCGIVCTDNGAIVRNPREFLQGFGWTSSFIYGSTRLMTQLLRAKALSTMFETPGCPIISVLAHETLNRTAGVAPRFIFDGYHWCPTDETKVPPLHIEHDTRVLFERLYGIPIATQYAAEDAIRAGDLASVSQLIPPPASVAHFAARYVVVRRLPSV